MVQKRTKKTTGGSSLSLRSRIVGSHGSNYVSVDIKEGESVLTSPGSLIYLRGDVEKGEIKLGGIGKAFARALAGEDLVLTSYTGGAKGGVIALGSALPGDVITFDIAPRQEVIISRGSLLCCTSNLEITATTRAQGILGIGQEEGFVLPVIKANDTGGQVWLSSYGSFERIDLADNETIIIDNGTFLACPKELNYEIVKLGKTLFSSAFGGEGFGMQFKGPTSMFIQSKNLNDFLAIVGNKTDMTAAKVGVGATVASGLFNWHSEGGRKTRKTRRT